MIEVYARRRNEEAATAFVRATPGSRLSNSRYFEAKEITKRTTKVYHDGETPLIPWVCAERGVPCELIPGFEGGETRHEAYQPTADHHVEKAGSWYKLMGPDGQVGKSVRSEAEAWAQLEGAKPDETAARDDSREAGD